MKFINQLQYPHIAYPTCIDPEHPRHEYGKTTTIKSSGCGLCSMVMVADRLIPNCEFELEDALKLSIEVGANRAVGTSSKIFFPAAAEKLGLRFQESKDINDLRQCLRTGGAGILLVAGDREGYVGLFSKGGHYLAVISEEPDGRFAILDPSFTDTKYTVEGRAGKVEVKENGIVLSEGKYMEMDSEPKPNPYLLFWRA